jgi:hypothetical protein
VAVLAFALYATRFRREETTTDEVDPLVAAWEALRHDRMPWRAPLVLFAGLVLILGSAFLLNIGGWQATLDLLGGWLAQFSGYAEGAEWLIYPRLLLVYETLPLIVGLIGLVSAFRRQDWFATMLGIWVVVALLVHLVAGQKAPGAVLMIVLPLILLAGQMIQRVYDWIRVAEIEPSNWLFLALAAILFSYLYVQLVGFALEGDPAFQTLAIVAGVVLAICFAVFWYWTGSEQALPIGAVTALLLLATLFLHSTFELNWYEARDPRELITRSPTSLDVLNVPPFLVDMSARYTLGLHTVPILIDRDLGPIVAWYTRKFSDVRFASTIPETPEERIVISKAPEGEADTGPSGYLGQTFRVEQQVDTEELKWGDWLKWYLRRYDIGTESYDGIEIWVRPQSS